MSVEETAATRRGRPPHVDGLLCLSQACAAVGVTRHAIEWAVKQGTLPSTRIGPWRYFIAENLSAYFPGRDELTAPGAAELAGVGVKAIEVAIDRGELPHRRLRGVRYVQLDALTTWSESYTTPKQREALRVAKRESEAVATSDHIGGAAALAAARAAAPLIADAIAAVDAARLAGVSWLTMRRAIARGDFESEVQDGARVVSREALIAWARAKRLILGP